MDFNSLTETDFTKNPVHFVELAHRWVDGDAGPQPCHEQWLDHLPRPAIAEPKAAREALWRILSNPQRARALSWLDRFGLLEEIIPSWSGDYMRQSLRLQAVEEIHLEHWAVGLSEDAYEWLCVYQDQLVDNRLNGWAATGLATLLLSGDEPAENFAARVMRDLKALGAKEGERERVLTAILEYPELYDAIAANRLPSRSFTPTTVIATLATIFVFPLIDPTMRTRACEFGDQILLRFAAPKTVKR